MLELVKLKLGIDVEDTEFDILLQTLIIEATYLTAREKFGMNEIPLDWVVPTHLEHVVSNVAIFLFNKLGIEGQVAHKDGDISRTYLTDGVPRSLFDSVLKEVKIL